MKWAFVGSVFFLLFLTQVDERQPLAFRAVWVPIESQAAPPATSQKSTATTPSTAKAFYDLGNRYYESKNYEEAIRNFELARDLNPDDTNILLGLLKSYYAVGSAEKVRHLLQLLKNREPTNAQLHIELGILFAGERQFAEGQRQFNLARDAAGDSYFLAYNEARMQCYEGNCAKALEILSSVPEEERKRGEYHNLLGLAYQELRQFDHALVEFREAVRIQPQKEEFHLNLGLLLLEVQSYDEAREAFSQASQLFPGSVRLLLGLGSVYRAQSNYRDAEHYFRKAVELDPKNEGAYILQGNAQLECGEVSAAKFTFRKTIKLNPSSAVAHFALATALLKENAVDSEAIVMLEKAITLEPRFPEPYYFLAKIRERQSRSAEAAELLEKAVALEPKLKKIHYALALSYQRLGETDKAMENFAIFQQLEQEEREDLRKKRLKPPT